MPRNWTPTRCGVGFCSSVIMLALVDYAHLHRLLRGKSQDLIYTEPFRQLMGDKNDRHLSPQPVHGLCEPFGCLLIQIARRLVKDEHPRTLQYGACDGQALLLAAGEADAVLADLGVVTVG